MQTYQLLAQRAATEPALVARCRVVNLDEWGGLALDDPASCGHSLRTALISPLSLADRYLEFDARAADPEAECARVAAWLERQSQPTSCSRTRTWPTCRRRRWGMPCCETAPIGLPTA
jgi:hypothetical protein